MMVVMRMALIMAAAFALLWMSWLLCFHEWGLYRGTLAWVICACCGFLLAWIADSTWRL
jgi:hypothetical protein